MSLPEHDVPDGSAVATLPLNPSSDGAAQLPVTHAIRHWEQYTGKEEQDALDASGSGLVSPSRRMPSHLGDVFQSRSPMSSEDLKSMMEKVAAEHFTALERRLDRLSDEVACERSSREGIFTSVSERLEAVAAQVDRVVSQEAAAGPWALASAAMLLQGSEAGQSSPKSKDPRHFEKLLDERIKGLQTSQATIFREQETNMRAMSNDLAAVTEGQRLQVLKVTQAVNELGRELSFRLERLEMDTASQAQRLQELNDGRLSTTSKRLEELADSIRTQGVAFGKQEAVLSILREDLKNEQRIRKEEINGKLRELLARPVRPEEQAVSDLRQNVASVRDDCSRLRAECRRLSSEVASAVRASGDSEQLAAVLRQLGSSLRSSTDSKADEVSDTRTPSATDSSAARSSCRGSASRSDGKSGTKSVGRGVRRVSPPRERASQSSSAAGRGGSSSSARPQTAAGVSSQRGTSPSRFNAAEDTSAGSMPVDGEVATGSPREAQSSLSLPLPSHGLADTGSQNKSITPGNVKVAIPPKIEIPVEGQAISSSLSTPTDTMANHMLDLQMQAQSQQASGSPRRSLLSPKRNSSQCCLMTEAPTTGVAKGEETSTSYGHVIQRAASAGCLTRPGTDARFKAAVAAVAAVNPPAVEAPGSGSRSPPPAFSQAAQRPYQVGSCVIVGAGRPQSPTPMSGNPAVSGTPPPYSIAGSVKVVAHPSAGAQASQITRVQPPIAAGPCHGGPGGPSMTGARPAMTPMMPATSCMRGAWDQPLPQ